MAYSFLKERSRASGVIAVTPSGVFALGVASTSAQDTSSDTVGPASIHLGTCDSLGDVVAELRDLAVMFDDDDDLAVGLREQNDSGFAGVALLDDDDDDNELDFDVYIAREVVQR